jgi:hypothetical protein
MELFVYIQILSMACSTVAVFYHLKATNKSNSLRSTKRYKKWARLFTAGSILLLGAAYSLAWADVTQPSKHDVKINTVHLMGVLFPITLLEILVATEY